MFKKILIAVAVAGGLFLAMPGAAGATDYTTGSPCQLDTSTVNPGGTVTLTGSPGAFGPSETVVWTASGQDRAGIQLPQAKQANADGSETIMITLPADADGVVAVTGVGQTTGQSCMASVTVIPSSASTSQNSTSTTPSTGLPNTGSVIATWVAWLGGGLILAGLIVLAIVYWARRIRSS